MIDHLVFLAVKEDASHEDIEDAQKLLERCLELAPGFAAARYNYAMLLHRLNDPERALAQVERLLSANPRNPGYRNLCAVILSRVGEYEPVPARRVRLAGRRALVAGPVVVAQQPPVELREPARNERILPHERLEKLRLGL